MDIDGLEIEVERKPIKNMHLSVYPPDGRVHLSVPDYLTEGDARSYVISKWEWIRKQQDEIAAQARQTALYELYTIAHSGSGVYVKEVPNMGEDVVVEAYTIEHHDPTGEQIAHADWENIFIALEWVFGILTALAAIGYIAVTLKPGKEEK